MFPSMSVVDTNKVRKHFPVANAQQKTIEFIKCNVFILGIEAGG